MSAKLKPPILLVFSVAVGLAAATFTLTPTSTQAQASNPPPAATASQQEVTNLSPLVVTGRKIPLPVALQMIKAALKRPVSYRSQDWHKLVCQFEGGRHHPPTLDCRTNCQRWEQSMLYQGVHVSTQLCYAPISPGFISSPGRIAATVAGWTDQQPINRGALLKLLKKLPPANSSYTLRVTDHGKVVAEYVFKHGKLVSVRKPGHAK
ncbi:MAG: hypothetical protein ACRES9_09095 [Gammaproteobacteria bacterium]